MSFDLSSARRRRTTHAGVVLSLAVAGLLLADSHQALAYVRYRAAAPAGTLGAPFAWGVSSISIVGYTHGIPTMPADQISAAMTTAAAAWSVEDPSNAACSFLALSVAVQPADTIPPDAAHDNVNTIAMRDGVWTQICSKLKDGSLQCHQLGELALTTVWSRTCGEVVEADVEVNADTSVGANDFMWADLDVTTSNGGFHDLQNALTHEMGHFIGLDHTCGPASATTGEVDDLNQPVPDCGDATLAEMDATMYPSAQAGDVSKRTLSPDDRNGLCSIYPLGTNPVTCGGLGGSSSGGCAVAPNSGELAPNGPRAVRWFTLLGGALGLGALIAARRRR